MSTFNIQNYIKNVSRSVAYVAVESFKEANPAITEFSESNRDVIKEMYSAARDFKKLARQGKQAVLDNEYSKIAKDTVANILDDLKTGNFYNKERAAKADGALMSGFGLDDWDLDLDNIDPNYGDDNNALTSQSMDNIGQKIAQSSGKAAVAAANYIVQANRASDKSMMAHNEMLFGKLNMSIAGIGATISSLGKGLSEQASTHYNNSAKFYDLMTKQSAEQTGYLKQIYTMLYKRDQEIENSRTKSGGKKRNTLSSIVGSSGMPDLSAYFNNVKSNFNEMTSMISSLKDMFGAFGGPGAMLRSMLSSPISSLMKMGSSAMIQKTMGKELKSLNKTLGGLFGSAMLRLNQSAAKNPFGLKGILAELLGVKTSTKKSIDPSKYEKGIMSWNGKDDKALREVIPTQLAQILSALTGEEAKIFDYERGKWVSYKGMQKKLDTDVRNISKRATSDIQDQFADYFLDDAKRQNNKINRNSRSYHTFRQDMANFFHFLTMNNQRIPTSNEGWRALEKYLNDTKQFVDKGTDRSGVGIMLYSNFSRIKSYYKRNYQNGRGYLNIQTEGNLMNARDDIGSFYENQETNGSGYSMLFNGSGLGRSKITPTKDNMITASIDDKGHNIFFYLQKFYSDLGRIADNTNRRGGNGGGTGRSQTPNGPRPSGSNRNRYEVPEDQSVIHQRSSKFRRQRNARREFVDIEDEGANPEQVKANKKAKDRAEMWKDHIEEGIKNNPIIKRMGKVGDVLASLLETPAKSVRSLLDSADKMIYQAVFGKQDDDNNPSILAKISKGFDDTFRSIKTSAKNFMRDAFAPVAAALGDKIAQLFGFNDFKGLRSSLANGIKNSTFVKGMGEGFKSAGRWAKNAVKDTIYETGDYFSGGKFSAGLNGLLGRVKSFGKRRSTESQAARGGQVTKSGMISVSEGELIIPGDMNPFYDKSYNRSKSASREKSIANKWLSKGGGNYWGNFAPGGTAREDKNPNEERIWAKVLNFRKEAEKLKDRAKKYGSGDKKNKSLLRKAAKLQREAEKLYNTIRKGAGHLKEDAQETYDDTMDDVRQTEQYKKVSSAFDWVANTVKNGALGVITRLFGKTVDENGNPIPEDKQKEGMSKAMSSAWNEVKKAAPSMAAGGIIGAGASLITGMVGGPLLGAAVGSAVGLATKSDKFTHYLFGDQDEKGNYKGGLFGPQLSNFLKKKAPRLAKFGLTGGAAGLLNVIPGGPIAGMMLGGALGFATENDRLRNYLFGEEGLLGQDTDKKIKERLPKIALGAGALAFTGPFGLVGNMMLGSAVGFVSQTDAFKKAIFGVKDSNGQLQGGLLGIIRKDIIEPAAGYVKGGMRKFEDYMIQYFFNPLKNVLRPLNNMFAHGLNKVGDYLKDLLTGELSDKISNPLLKMLYNTIAKPLTKRIGWVADKGIKLAAMPGKVFAGTMNRVGTSLDRKAIKGGYSSLSAEQRVLRATTDRKLKNSNYATKAYDQAAAGMSAEELQKNKDALKLYQMTMRGDRIDKKQLRKDSLDRILADSEWGTTLKQDKFLTQAINNSAQTGNFDDVYQVISMLDKQGKLNGKTDKLMQFLQGQENEIKRIDSLDRSEIINNADTAARRLAITKEQYAGSNALRRLLNNDSKAKNDAVASGKTAEAEKSDYDKMMEAEGARHDQLMGTLKSIGQVLCKIAGIDPQVEFASKASNVIQNAIRTARATEEKAEAKNEEQEDERVEILDDGTPATYRRDSKGNWFANLRDSATKKALDAKKFAAKQRDKLTNSLSKIGGLFGDKLFGKKDEETKKRSGGLLSTLLGGAGSFFTESGVGKAILSVGALAVGGNALSWLDKHPEISKSLSNTFQNIGDWFYKFFEKNGEVIVNGALSGLGAVAGILIKSLPKSFDELFTIMRNSKAGYDNIEDTMTGHDSSTYGEGEYERANITDRYLNQGLLKNSIIKGQTGNKVIKAIPFVGAHANRVLKYTGKARNWAVDKFAGSKAGKALGTKLVESNAGKFAASTVSKVASSKAGKFATSTISKVASSKVGTMVSKAGSVVSKAGEIASKVSSKGLSSGIIGKLKTLVTSAISKAMSLMGVKGAEKVAKEAAEEVVQQAAEAGAEKVTKSFAKSAALPVQIAFVAAAVENGWEDAKSILGILDDPSFKERGLAAMANGINEAIPGIGGVIPTETLLSLLLNILNAAGVIDASALMQKRTEAREIVDQYNAENGKTYNVREYIKNVLGEYTTQEKIGNAVKSAVGGITKIPGAIVKGAKGAMSLGRSVGKKAVDLHRKAVSVSAKAIKKGAGVIATGTKTILKSIKDGTAKEKVMDVMKMQAEGVLAINKMREKMIQGIKESKSIKDVYNTPLEVSDKNPLKGIINVIGDAIRLPLTGMAIATNGFNILADKVKSMFSGAVDTVSEMKKMIGQLWEFTDHNEHKDMSGFDDIIKGDEEKKGGIFDKINGIARTIIGGMMRMVVNLVRPITAAGDFLKDKLGIGSSNNKNKDDESIPTSDGTKDKKSVSPWKKFTNWVTGGDSGIHVSQKDPSYANSKYGSRTISEIGCGPAAAATILKRYGKNTNIKDTAAYANVNGYVAGSSGIGTRASYFGDILGSNGIRSSYTSNKNSIAKAIGSGSPTVLLGQDKTNRSKSNSPFGPNPHYVVAQGTDRKGNIVVDDPEMGGTSLYKRNILKNAKLGVVTGGDSGLQNNNYATSKLNPMNNLLGSKTTDTNVSTTSASSNGDYIGRYVKKYESGNKGSLMISSGTGDNGGVSFGSYQFPSYKKTVTTEGNLPAFWNQFYASKFPGVQPGNNEAFKAAWTNAVSSDPSGFFNNEHAFVTSKYYSPIANALVSNGVGDPTGYDRAAQEAAWSTAVQLGPTSAARLFKEAGVNTTMKPVDFITKLYDKKIANVDSNFKSSSQAVRNSIRNRYNEEKQILLGLAGKPPISPSSTNGAIATGGDVATGLGTTQTASSNPLDLGGAIDKVLKAGFTKIFEKLGSKGSAFASAFGFTNTDNNEATNANVSNTAANSADSTGTAISGDKANNFPYYNQADPRWGSKPYGKNTIAGGGCGPSSMAMVLKSYGKNYTPVEAIDYSMKNGFRVEGQGTSWDYFKSIGSANGLTTTQFTGNAKAKEYLSQNIPVIGSMRPGDFTKGGHFIVFSGLKGDQVTVNDPGSKDRTQKLWGADSALSQAKQFWAVSNNGKGSLNQSLLSDTNNSLGMGSGLIMHDFTKPDMNKPRHNSSASISKATTKQAIRKINNDIKQYGGDSGLLNGDTLKMFQTALTLLESIANNTSYNANMKTIVEILSSMAKIMNVKVQSQASSSSAPTDTDDTQNEMISVMNKLKLLSETA